MESPKKDFFPRITQIPQIVYLRTYAKPQKQAANFANSRELFKKLAEIRATPHWRAAQVFVAKVFELHKVSSQYFGAKPNAKSPRPKVAKIFE